MNDNFVFGNEKRLILIADDEEINREILLKEKLVFMKQF